MRTFKFILGALLPLFVIAVLAHAGSIIQPASGGGVPVSQQAGWLTALNCDLTAESTQALDTDGTYTICSQTATKVNSGHQGTTHQVLNGTGLQISTLNGTTVFAGGSSTTAPGVFFNLSTLIPSFTLTTPLQVDVQITTTTPNNSTQCFVAISDGSPTGTGALQTAIGVGKSGATDVQWSYHYIQGSGAVQTGAFAAGPLTERMELPTGVIMPNWVYYSSSSSTVWTETYQPFATAIGTTATFTSTTVPAAVSSFWVGIVANDQGALGSAFCTLTHLRIRYKN